jgi:D-psicose/D-tagatose/L-ribulose 3-epimerase
MRLSVSNIAWDTSRMDEFLCMLSKAGCDGIELSPSMIWPEPISVPDSEIISFKEKVNAWGLEISSMHSLTYTKPDLSFFDSTVTRRKLIQYIVDLGRLANLLKIPVMVFGSAKSRMIGNRDRERCYDILTESFGEMAAGLAPHNVVLLIEPLSKQYVDCIVNTDEAVSLIKRVNRRNFALHVDLKSSFEEREDYGRIWSVYRDYIKHCHVANPNLDLPGPECPEHAKAAEAVRDSGYNGYISLEVKRVADPLLLEKSIGFVKEVYFNKGWI